MYNRKALRTKTHYTNEIQLIDKSVGYHDYSNEPDSDIDKEDELLNLKLKKTSTNKNKFTFSSLKNVKSPKINKDSDKNTYYSSNKDCVSRSSLSKNKIKKKKNQITVLGSRKTFSYLDAILSYVLPSYLLKAYETYNIVQTLKEIDTKDFLLKITNMSIYSMFISDDCFRDDLLEDEVLAIQEYKEYKVHNINILLNYNNGNTAANKLTNNCKYTDYSHNNSFINFNTSNCCYFAITSCKSSNDEDTNNKYCINCDNKLEANDSNNNDANPFINKVNINLNYSNASNFSSIKNRLCKCINDTKVNKFNKLSYVITNDPCFKISNFKRFYSNIKKSNSLKYSNDKLKTIGEECLSSETYCDNYIKQNYNIFNTDNISENKCNINQNSFLSSSANLTFNYYNNIEENNINNLLLKNKGNKSMTIDPFKILNINNDFKFVYNTISNLNKISEIKNNYKLNQDIINTSFIYSKRTLTLIAIKGITSYIRPQFWLIVSGAKHDLEENKSYYNSLIKNYPVPLSSERLIDLDLKRTFPSNPYFRDCNNLKKLKNVIYSYAKRNLSIGYVQGFNFIAGKLLLYMNSNEEQAFFLFKNIIEYQMPVNYYSEMCGVMADVDIMIKLIYIFIPNLYDHFVNNDLIEYLKNILLQWFLSVFTHNFPEELCLFVLDLLFIQGSIVLLKISYLIIKENENRLMQIRSIPDLIAVLNKSNTRELMGDIAELKLKILEDFILDDDVLSKNRSNISLFIEQKIMEINTNKIINKKKELDNLINENIEEYCCDVEWPICLYDYDNLYNVVDFIVFQTNDSKCLKSIIIENYFDFNYFNKQAFVNEDNKYSFKNPFYTNNHIDNNTCKINNTEYTANSSFVVNNEEYNSNSCNYLSSNANKDNYISTSCANNNNNFNYSNNINKNYSNSTFNRASGDIKTNPVNKIDCMSKTSNNSYYNKYSQLRLNSHDIKKINNNKSKSLIYNIDGNNKAYSPKSLKYSNKKCNNNKESKIKYINNDSFINYVNCNNNISFTDNLNNSQLTFSNNIISSNNKNTNTSNELNVNLLNKINNIANNQILQQAMLIKDNNYNNYDNNNKRSDKLISFKNVDLSNNTTNNKCIKIKKCKSVEHLNKQINNKNINININLDNKNTICFKNSCLNINAFNNANTNLTPNSEANSYIYTGDNILITKNETNINHSYSKLSVKDKSKIKGSDYILFENLLIERRTHTKKCLEVYKKISKEFVDNKEKLKSNLFDFKGYESNGYNSMCKSDEESNDYISHLRKYKGKAFKSLSEMYYPSIVKEESEENDFSSFISSIKTKYNRITQSKFSYINNIDNLNNKNINDKKYYTNNLLSNSANFNTNYNLSEGIYKNNSINKSSKHKNLSEGFINMNI